MTDEQKLQWAHCPRCHGEGFVETLDDAGNVASIARCAHAGKGIADPSPNISLMQLQRKRARENCQQCHGSGFLEFRKVKDGPMFTMKCQHDQATAGGFKGDANSSDLASSYREAQNDSLPGAPTRIGSLVQQTLKHIEARKKANKTES